MCARVCAGRIRRFRIRVEETLREADSELHSVDGEFSLQLTKWRPEYTTPLGAIINNEDPFNLPILSDILSTASGTSLPSTPPRERLVVGAPHMPGTSSPNRSPVPPTTAAATRISNDGTTPPRGSPNPARGGAQRTPPRGSPAATRQLQPHASPTAERRPSPRVSPHSSPSAVRWEAAKKTGAQRPQKVLHEC